MKLEKAKELLKLELIGPACLSNPDLKDAVKLGVEAIQRVQDCRVGNPAEVELPLSGESPPGDSPQHFTTHHLKD